MLAAAAPPLWEPEAALPTDELPVCAALARRLPIADGLGIGVELLRLDHRLLQRHRTKRQLNSLLLGLESYGPAVLPRQQNHAARVVSEGGH